MQTLRSYVNGSWFEGKEPFATLVNPATEEPLARASTNGLGFGAALEYARGAGGPALREMTFAQRVLMSELSATCRWPATLVAKL